MVDIDLCSLRVADVTVLTSGPEMVSSAPDPFRTAPLKHAVWSLDGLILVRLEASCIGSGAERDEEEMGFGAS